VSGNPANQSTNWVSPHESVNQTQIHSPQSSICSGGIDMNRSSKVNTRRGVLSLRPYRQICIPFKVLVLRWLIAGR